MERTIVGRADHQPGALHQRAALARKPQFAGRRLAEGGELKCRRRSRGAGAGGERLDVPVGAASCPASAVKETSMPTPSAQGAMTLKAQGAATP